MLCVKSIDVVEVDRDNYRIRSVDRKAWIPYTDPSKKVAGVMWSELVIGRKFFNAHGECICIGMSKQAQSAIGLPMGIFQDMADEAERQKETISGASFLCRLKYLFTKKGLTNAKT